MSDVVDAAENYLDEHGLDRPHLAGNSMGAFMAIELARRGRAATVWPCPLPACGPQGMVCKLVPWTRRAERWAA